jgi:PAS domain S-box-containing protein
VITAAVHPADVACVQNAIQATLTQGQPLQLEHRIVWSDGSIRYVAVLARLTYDADGNPHRLTGLIRDVTKRREAEEELQYKNRLLENVLQNMPVALMRVALDGTLVEASGAGLQRIGTGSKELVGASIFQAFPNSEDHLRKLLDEKQSTSFVAYSKYDSNERAYWLNYGFYEQQQDSAVLFSIDVTDTQKANDRLQAERDFTQSLLENIADGIMAFDADLHVTAWNHMVEEYSGVAREHIMGKDVFDALPRYEKPIFREVEARLRAGLETRHYNLPFDTREGTFDVHFVPLHDGKGHVTGGLGVVRDVTERNRLMEEATQLRLHQQKEVLSAIMNTQEDERKRIAEALHNGVGQLLYATKLHLDPRPVDDSHRESALALLNEAIRATRTISFELTPNVLQDFGLKAALEELSKRIPRRNLVVHLHIDQLDAPLPRVLEIAVYRIAQELLNNVIKHAQAREAFVYVEREGGNLRVSVEDDGIGFDTESVTKRRSGIGLAGIRNRVELLAGKLIIRSQPGRGTTISIDLPIVQETSETAIL